MRRVGLHTRLHVIMVSMLAIAVMAVAVIGFTKPAFAVSANDCVGETGTQCWHGYFDWGHYNQGGGDVIPGGIYVSNATQFTNMIGSYLNCAAFPNNQHATGAAFIVLTMLGVAPDNSNPGGINKYEACNRFNEWRNRVFDYERKGLINWNTNYTYYTNSFYQGPQNDDAYYTLGYNETAPSIIFLNPYNTAQVLYGLRIECGNPVGWHAGLIDIPTVNWNLSSWSSTPNTNVYPGETARFYYNIHNNGPNTASFQFGDRTQFGSGGVAAWPSTNSFVNVGNGGNAPGYGIQDVPIPASQVNAGKVCSWTAYDPRAVVRDFSQGGGESNHSCVTITPPSGQCVNPAVLTPSQVMPGQSFTIASSIKYQDTRAATSARNNGVNYTVRVVRLVGPTETQVFQQTGIATSVDVNGNLVGATVTVPATAITVAGQYRVYFGNNGAIGNRICGGGTSFDAAFYPYFSNVGGDIIAGAGFTQGTTCTDTIGAGIKGWNNGGPYYGAGSQLAALAIGDIIGFASAVNSIDGSSSTATPPGVAGAGNNLTFSNVATSGRLGNTSLPCMPDYYTKANAQATVTGGALITKANLEGFADGDYKKYTGNVIIGIGGNATINGDGRQITLVIDGNAYINTNILYGSYTDPNNIPRLTLIVRGNLYIDSNVTELHGIYIAQAQGVAGKGTVFTCSTGFTGISTYVTCNRPLTFYGAVAAENIRLGRTYGNLIPVGATPRAAAESFVYTPELWLANSGISTESGQQPYDAITSLPPTL
ncbi:MAG: hypothetical protein JWM37_136 [Candidatus Saccharibacteria bacterium]|nr:hypothetical protein [Candidatus Saccharibacteria bacterium]